MMAAADEDEDEMKDKEGSIDGTRRSSTATAGGGGGSVAGSEKGSSGGGGVAGLPIKEEELQSLMEKAKFYTSLCLGTTAILSVFAFLFLIPFVVDPAISTILADYQQKAVTCIAVSHIYSEGLSNCSWASCREGCTTAALRCHQILVNYSRLPFETWAEGEMELQNMEWDVEETKFYINTEGCGYPPRVNCSEFAKKYGYKNLFKPFPCYYSRNYPEMVVARYNWDDNLRHLILSLIIPNVLFGVSIGVLSYWYCPRCNRQLDTTTFVEKFPPPKDEEMEEDEDNEY